MKQGLFSYKAKGEYKNIGDYVQSVAAQQYLTENPILIDREELNSYQGEEMKLIMNGWYMHKPENWPPSPKIKPLLISMHMTPNIGERMLTKKGIEYFKQFGPVGCRDQGTAALLQSKGIPAYFSGCLTLTLGKTFQHKESSTKIRFVDPFYNVSRNPFKLLGYLLLSIKKRKAIRIICKKLLNEVNLKNLMKTSAFFQAYSNTIDEEVLVDADYLTHRILESTLGDEAAKFQFTNDLLNKYADSQLVITSRIHVTLPCLGIGTPVLFIISDHYRKKPTSKGRFEGIIELFNVMEYDNYSIKPILGFQLNGKIDQNFKLKNKDNYLKIANELDEKCKEFIAN